MPDYVYPYPCGWFLNTQQACGRVPAVVTKYQKRISGPLLNRIDIHIEVPRVDYGKLTGDRMGETSEAIRKCVQVARNIQQQRFVSSQSDIICNADRRVGEIRQYCKLQDESQSLMRLVTHSTGKGHPLRIAKMLSRFYESITPLTLFLIQMILFVSHQKKEFSFLQHILPRKDRVPLTKSASPAP